MNLATGPLPIWGGGEGGEGRLISIGERKTAFQWAIFLYTHYGGGGNIFERLLLDTASLWSRQMFTYTV